MVQFEIFCAITLCHRLRYLARHENQINPRSDFIFAVMQQATGEAGPEPELTGKKADNRKGGLKSDMTSGRSSMQNNPLFNQLVSA